MQEKASLPLPLWGKGAAWSRPSAPPHPEKQTSSLGTGTRRGLAEAAPIPHIVPGHNLIYWMHILSRLEVASDWLGGCSFGVNHDKLRCNT